MYETCELCAPWSHDEKFLQWNYLVFDAVEAGERPPVTKGHTAPHGFVALMESCQAQASATRGCA